jgi:hypothetical protein
MQLGRVVLWEYAGYSGRRMSLFAQVDELGSFGKRIWG